MKKIFAILGLALSLSGCASTEDLGDFPLMWDEMHAILHVHSPEGKEIQPFEGQLIQFSGYSFSEAGVGILPGKKSVRYACPTSPNYVDVTDYIPTISFNFQAGRQYDLRCVNGAPVVTER